MSDAIRLLEDRVQRAVARLRELSSERRRLESELSGLRERLERLEAGGPGPEDAGDDPRRWPLERVDVVATLRETIEQLQD